ncbi:hypothetical protein Sjap_023128 [Stephania japonica]|uniref:Major facilitator superfamily (MFS) profile domain-containing protein n=1 Tax=Stephania japonica TaxID=461633 RepID=A0AAP0EQP1_9MAGN
MNCVLIISLVFNNSTTSPRLVGRINLTVTGFQMGNETPKFTVDEALQITGFGKFQFLVLAYAGMGWVSEAMEMMLLSFVGPAVQSDWKLSSHQQSLITSIVFAGMLLGAYSWGVVSDKHGRRSGFLITAIITTIAGFFSAFAPNYITLMILRCLVGVGLGGGPVLSSWFLEFVPAPDRGIWMVIFSAFWTLGTILEASLALFIMPTLGWRWLLALSSLPSLVLLLFYCIAPESPRYLCLQGRTTEALAILEKVATMNHVKLPPGILVSDHKNELNETPSEDTTLLSQRENKTMNIDSKVGWTSSLFMLFSPELRKTTLLLWVVFFGNAFSYYGLVLLTSELSIHRSGCGPVALHSDNSLRANPYGDVFITSIAEFPGLLLAAVTVDRLGRKLSMSSMLFLSCLFLLPLIFNHSENLTTGLLFGARMSITGSFAILYIYAPEIYPTSVRTTGVGVGSSVGRLGGMVCPLVAVGLVSDCHRTAAILLFGAIVLFSGVAVVLFPLETKGRELSDSLQKSKPFDTEI